MFGSTPHTWLPGKITKVTGPLYIIELSDGCSVRRHVDSIRRRDNDIVIDSPSYTSDLYLPDISRSPVNESNVIPPPPRRLNRIHRPPLRYTN